MTTRRALPAFVLASALLVASASSAAAKVKTETATSGPLTAEMSYNQQGFSGFNNLRIKIVRNGSTLLDEKAPPPGGQTGPPCNSCSAFPAGGGETTSVHALRLDADAEPEAIFDLYTGGAHCCFYSLIYRYDAASNSYLPLEHDWFDAFYRLIDPDGDGIPVFLSRDDRFAFKYSAYAFSRYPPQVWRYDAGQMLDVTSQYPTIVRRNAKSQLQSYNRGKGHRDVRAALAAFVADKCLLGSCGDGFDLVRAAKQKGFLADRFTEFGPSNGRFVKNLRRFLGRLGYR